MVAAPAHTPDLPTAADWRALITALIAADRFTRRPYSWVCAHEDHFLKIPRAGTDHHPHPAAPEVIAEATAEFERTTQLRGLDPAVDAPVLQVGGCLVKRRLRGPELADLIAAEIPPDQIQSALESCLALVGRLHRGSAPWAADLPLEDYRTDPFLAATPDLAARIQTRPATLVIDGVQVRNFRQRADGAAWSFFDPHGITHGAPEDDVARFVISLVMIRFGRRLRCRAWVRFDLDALRRAYERTAPTPLDPEIFAYMLRRHVAKRRHEAAATRRRMPTPTRLAAAAYAHAFFAQIHHWGRQNGIDLGT